SCDMTTSRPKGPLLFVRLPPRDILRAPAAYGSTVQRRRGGRVPARAARQKDELLSGNAYLIAGLEESWPHYPHTVDAGAVLRSGIVQFTRLVGVDQDGAVAARGVDVLQHHVVVAGSSDGVDTDLEGVEELSAREPAD